MTLLAGEIYLLRLKPEDHDQVEVYDVNTYHLLRHITVPDARRFTDMTSCEHYRCVYIGDWYVDCIHRLDVQGTVTRWAVNDQPLSLSVNAAHNVIVTCPIVGIIKEFSSHGDLLRELKLLDDVIWPWHAIQTRSGRFIVYHGGFCDSAHRVCMMRADGRRLVHSHGGRRGSVCGQDDSLNHLVVDDNEFVFVADQFKRRVTLLSPTLEYVRQVVSRDQLMGIPHRLYLDTQQRLLYVAICDEFKDSDDKWYVAVFSV